MKRMIAIGLTVLLVMGVLVVLEIVPVMKVSANDPVWVVDHYETAGDWDIDGTSTIFTFTSTSIIVNGNLTINSGYTLTLQEVDLLMNTSYNGEYFITVKSGGSLIIEDMDNNHQTTADASVISGTNRFGFLVDGPSGSIVLKNSELHDCGWTNSGPDWENAGLNIQSPNAIITGNDISNNYRGVILHKSLATGATVENNTIHNNQATGLHISSGSINNHIAHNDIYSNQFGIWVNSSMNSQTNFIINNDIRENSFIGILIEDSSNFRIEGNNIINQTVRTGINLTYSQDIRVINNIFDGNGGSGSSDADCAIYSEAGTGIVISNNYFTNSNRFGLRAQHQPDIVAEHNVFENNLGGGAIMIFVNITNFGIINNNTITNAGWHGIFVDGCNNFKVTNNTINNVGVAGGRGLVNQNYYSNSPLKVYIYKNDIRNIGTSTLGVGMTLSSGSYHVVDSNYFDIITSHGMAITASYSTIKNNVVESVGTALAANSIDDIAGITLAGTQNTLINNTVRDCQSLGGAYLIAGLQFGYSGSGSYARNTVIKDSVFDNNEINIRSEEPNGPVSNIVIENSTIIYGTETTWDFYLVDNAHLTTINSTFDNTSLSIDASSDLTVKWYLNVNVKNGGSGQDGADLYIQDVLGKNEPPSQPLTTKTIDSEPGWVKWIPLTEYIQDGSTKTYYTSHWVNASYFSMEGLARPKMWMSHDIELILNSIPTVSDLIPDPSIINRTETVDLVVESSDVEDSESQLTPYFEYREPSDYSWNTSYLGIPNWDSTNQWWNISFTPPTFAPIGEYDIRVRVEDTYGSFSSYITLINTSGIDVKNNLPYVEGMSNVSFGSAPSGAIFRGENIWIYGDGEDVEDGDDQNFITTEIQYKRPGEPSYGTHTFYWQGPPSTGAGDWFQDFLPTGDIFTPLGEYSFQVRFMDTDGDWGNWKNLENITVLNKPPEFIDFNKQSGSVYRGDDVRIYVNASDSEENEQDLQVNFYYKHSVLGTIWEDTWFSDNGIYDGNQFYAKFNPPYSADIGIYEFMVEITDQYSQGVPGDTISETPSGTSINVLNNLPVMDDIKMSSSTVRADVEAVYVHVNASDLEDLEAILEIVDIEWRENNSETPGVPPTPSDWIKDASKMNINPNVGYSGSYIRASISPTSFAYKGWHDIRIKVKDSDGGQDAWRYFHKAFQVTNPMPTLHDITLQKEQIFRGETVYITLNASDLGQTEDTLEVQIQFKKIGTSSWSDIGVSASDYTTDDGGYWKIPFTPDISWDDDKLGDYEFQGRVKNKANAFSNNGNYNATDADCEVKNYVPEAVSIGTDATTVERTSTIIIYAKANDADKAEDDLICEFEYNAEGSGWRSISNPDYNNAQTQWEIEFTPDDTATIGEYTFRVRFYDGLAYSTPYLELQSSIEVTNAEPVVTSLMVSKSTAYRLDDIILTAIVSDTDQDTSTLTPNFQYQGPDDNDWVSQTTTNYFKNANEVSPGQWQVTFSPPTSAKVGEYIFQVDFTDNADVTCIPYQSLQTLTLENADPEVEITSPSPGPKKSTKISFDASASDLEDSTFDWLWNFGDGDESTEESPSHEYAGPGAYLVTVTITDGDQATATDEFTIVIEGEGESNLMMILLLLIPIIVVVLLLVVLITRKKKPQDVPPSEPQAAAPEAPIQPAQTQAVAAPVAQAPPAPAPAAQVPMVGAPAQAAAAPAGGQRIKCPKCGTPFTVTSTERPITIECPNCGTKGQLN
jgi:parallel beta-helix repeat protein